MKTVLTNGVFDVIHTGHIKLLEYCKNQGDYLIVAIDTDSRVKKIKGENRPVNTEKDRKAVLEAIRFVDEVVMFDTMEELQSLYTKIKPDILVKGNECSAEELRKKDGIPNYIEIHMCPFMEGYSTTGTMKKIKNLSSCEKVQGV